ncbi:hypothetical protein DIPPA_27143 [Diplonema papillatum]|nr:hypothetical protein DIPPA_27143 [Diplonema papillatum]
MLDADEVFERERSDADCISDEQRQQAAENVFTEMFQHMDSGDMVRWAKKHLSEKLHFIIAGKIADPSEDRVVIGRQAFLEWYNAMLELRQVSSTVWDITQDVHMLSKETFLIYWKQTISCGETPQRTREKQYIMSRRDGRVHHLCMAPRFAEEEMGDSILLLRSCLPPSDAEVPNPPCRHNSWDSMRAKNSVTVLKCRECLATWRLRADLSHRFRCNDFLDGHCPVQPGCRRIHVHARKKRAYEYS